MGILVATMYLKRRCQIQAAEAIMGPRLDAKDGEEVGAIGGNGGAAQEDEDWARASLSAV